MSAAKCSQCRGPLVGFDGQPLKPAKGVPHSALCGHCFMGRPFNVQKCARCNRDGVLVRLFLYGAMCDDCNATCVDNPNRKAVTA